VLIYFAGQDVGLTASPLDDAGAPATGTLAATVTVTDPTGVTSTPATVNAGSGVYTAVLPSVAAVGVWLYRWTATGPGVNWADEGQFSVRPLGVEQIVDIASVRAHLNLTQTTSDDELQGFILAAGELARDVVGPLLPEQHTQIFDGGTRSIIPDWLPLASVQSVTEYYGLSAFVLTEQPLGSQQNAFGYTVDLSTGQITRRTFGGEAALFAIGNKNVKVTYTAGRGGAIPWTVRLGALELIRHLWQLTQQGGGPWFGGSVTDGESAPVPAGFALPARVLELWAPYRRPPGIA
jgi:hypothetical protein